MNVLVILGEAVVRPKLSVKVLRVILNLKLK